MCQEKVAINEELHDFLCKEFCKKCRANQGLKFPDDLHREICIDRDKEDLPKGGFRRERYTCTDGNKKEIIYVLEYEIAYWRELEPQLLQIISNSIAYIRETECDEAELVVFDNNNHPIRTFDVVILIKTNGHN